MISSNVFNENKSKNEKKVIKMNWYLAIDNLKEIKTKNNQLRKRITK